ncbi:hypothetical protein AMAG_15103 [Allomyces macrogynus ATCC 38327]|uniref:Uncharacterized protein n=1 Tax=Allomyces macrogynus (strain ATCC 38327) TaxID=578462 RepID=A0A0L0T5V2_ALLM3|nr:hypothetical protein AMAG_15103 [Allomyces macrogynus ATCC 38327]|eukprot:KNE70127.1 hypothetical protein AMAG_15103 [Allomyces macrogynus ATCC 38327]
MWPLTSRARTRTAVAATPTPLQPVTAPSSAPLPARTTALAPSPPPLQASTPAHLPPASLDRRPPATRALAPVDPGDDSDGSSVTPGVVHSAVRTASDAADHLRADATSPTAGAGAIAATVPLPGLTGRVLHPLVISAHVIECLCALFAVLVAVTIRNPPSNLTSAATLAANATAASLLPSLLTTDAYSWPLALAGGALSAAGLYAAVARAARLNVHVGAIAPLAAYAAAQAMLLNGINDEDKWWEGHPPGMVSLIVAWRAVVIAVAGVHARKVQVATKLGVVPKPPTPVPGAAAAEDASATEGAPATGDEAAPEDRPAGSGRNGAEVEVSPPPPAVAREDVGAGRGRASGGAADGASAPA